ncbi:MAG: methyltransferase domain-containing protein [Thermoplasmata archaeon]|nr:methyltransferase domain-containing protein [Thermoplasmata archaeon]
MEIDPHRTEIQMIEKFSTLRDKHILEVGCGDGRVSGKLAIHTPHLTAIDPDEETMALAKSNVQNVDFRVGFGENLDFDDKSFDAVIFTFSLHHQESSRALAEAFRVLKPGGQTIIIEPSVEGEVHQFFRTFRNEDQQLAIALEAIQNSSFDIEKQETFSIDWTFDNNEELYSYFFNHYKLARDAEFVKKMELLLNNKIYDRPISLSELAIIFSLRRDNS